jgi:class 3 adenylate cyclase
VLFTDFKGFTARSASMTPEEVIEELNKCFSAFDAIVEKYNLEKIKTIGDAYMCAGGLPIPNQSNPIDAVRAGLAMQEYMTAYKNECIAKGEPYFECRLGINTGEVVAGVVGTKKFAYDIWGDTVKSASRAESNGSLGKVNITETTYELVKDVFKCEYRGDIEVKGKGQMKMYFVLE